MTAIVYPSSLPAPSSAPLQWAERRQLSSLLGPRGSRILWTDRLGSQSLEFILRSEAQVQTWVDWVRDDLEDGAAWFSASWPQPQGGVGVRRFIGAPSYPEYLPVIGSWRVSALCEVRGRGELPMDVRDPLWDHVVLLIQNGEIEDKSKYGRSLTTLAATPDIDLSGAPSGKGILVSGSIASCGMSWFFNATTTPELVFSTDAICIETFMRLNVGRSGPQILYGDEHGMRSSGIVLGPGGLFGDDVRCDMNTPAGPGSFTDSPDLANGVVYHLAVQKIGLTTTLYIDGSGYVGNGNAVALSLNDPVSPSTPPCIGRMTGQEGDANFNFEQYRITTVVPRYTEGFTPPTALFPTR